MPLNQTYNNSVQTASRSNKRISPLGGAVPVLKQIRDMRIPQLIRSVLGDRKAQSKYSYEDILVAWMLTNFCGGIRLDHITKLRRDLSVIPDLKLPSHDTLGRVMKNLATDTASSEKYSRKGSKKKITIRQTCENVLLNRLLIKTARRSGLLNRAHDYTLDMDATIVFTDCYDSRYTYKHKFGYSPMVSFIGEVPVYIGMRNGNVAPSAEAKQCLEKTFSRLEEEGITVSKVRMDGASYKVGMYDYLHEDGKLFYIAASKRDPLMNKLRELDEWEPVELETTQNFWNCEAGSVNYKLHGGAYEYRLAVFRIEKDVDGLGPRGWMCNVEAEYAYKVIITNDFQTPTKDIIEFYNQRGAAERNFAYLKREFGWRLPPFSNMNENLVFLFIGALASVVYKGVLRRLGRRVRRLRFNMRLPEFLSQFMIVSFSYNKKQRHYTYYNNPIIPYERLM